MPTQEQTSVRLFKKDLGIGDTSTPRAFFEEPFASGALVKPSQILSQFNEVPGTAPIGMVHDEIIGVIQRKIDVVLTAVPGTTNSFQHDDLKDVVPFNHADGTYNYVIKDNLDNPIQFGQGDWVIDTVAGILIFYGAVPANMPPKISFYKYVGEKGTGSQTYYIVPDLTTRNSIPPSQRRDGTMCYVQADTDTYQLQGGIDNINWVNITKQIGLPENEVLANNSAGSFIIVNWSAKWSFVMYFRADRGASAFESGQIRIDYNDGQAYYEATGGRLENLGLTFDINVNGANLEFDWTTTDNVDDIALTYNIGNLAYVDGGGAIGDMLASVYDPTNIAGDAFDMDNMADGATNRLYDSTEKSKLAGIEAGAQVNPTASAIKTLYESNADTNAYTDADASKLAGIEAGAQVNPDAATIKTLYESNADTNAYDDAAVAKLSDLPDGEWLHNSNSSARLWGGIITDNGNGTVAIAAGEGLIKAQEAGAEDVPSTINQGQGSLLSVVSWTAVASLALVNEAYNFIFYDGNTGTIQATTDFSSISFTRDFTLGRAYRSGTDIVVRLCGTNLWNFNRRVQLFGEEVFPVIRASGMVVGDEGTRHFSLTAGVLWAELVNRFSTAAFNSTAADTYIAWYNDGAWQQQTGQSQINNTQYNNYGVGLVNLSNNQYGVHWVYMVHDSTVHVVYGRDSYTLSEADAAQPPAELPGLLLSYATLVAKITIGRNDTELTSAESAFALQFNSSAIIPHDELSGLNVGDYQHLTSAQKTALTTGVNADAQHIHGVEAVVYSTTHSHVNTVQDLINHMWSIGACQDGFDITDNTDGTVDLTAGSVVLRSTNTYHGELNGYAVSAVSNLTLTNNATNFVMADYNSGTPIITSSSNWNDVFSDNTKALIYVVNRLNNQLNIIDFRGNNVDFITRNNVKTYKTKRVEHASGAMISDEGSLEFAITASEFYILNKSIIVPAFDTSGTDTFEYVYRDGAGGWTRVASQTAINGLYCDDNSGTLALVINHEFGIHWVYAVLNEPTNFKIVYGQDSYATLAEAQAAQAPSSLPSDLDALSTAVLIGKIIIEEDAPTVFADIQSPFVDILQSANVNTHNNLAGLNAGDYQHLTAAEKTKFDNLQLPMVRYQADQFLNVSSTVADYAVNAGAIVNLDDNDNGLLIREFDDTTEEGVGFVETIPEGATNIIIELKSRAKTAPGAAAAVVPTIYVRDIPDNAVVGAWDAGTDLTAIALPTNEYFQYDTQTIALTTLGLSAGDVFQFELTRNTGSASDTLSGDWCLLEMILKFE